jgi:hypothetical protein
MPESVKIAVVGYLPTMHRQRDSMHERVEALKIAA